MIIKSYCAPHHAWEPLSELTAEYLRPSAGITKYTEGRNRKFGKLTKLK